MSADVIIGLLIVGAGLGAIIVLGIVGTLRILYWTGQFNNAENEESPL